MKDLHVTLPDALAEATDRLASELGETRNGLLRRALEDFLEAERKRKIAAQMKEYAERLAADSGEFVKETGAAVARKLLRETRW